MNQNDFKHRLELCSKLYAALVKNRLRDLETPSNNEQSRWIWELIQNAKDCSNESICLLPNSNKKPELRHVKIKITYSNKVVIFEHNGFPFNHNTLDSLMYQYSSKGENDSTGRFGTGFITTHTLSKVIEISAPYIDDDGRKKYITAKIFRNGQTKKQLVEEFIKMEQYKTINDFDPNNEDHKWTKFTYPLKDPMSTNSLNLGIQSFNDNIFKTLLFCPEIDSFEINNKSSYECSLLDSQTINDALFPEKITIDFKKLKSKEEEHDFIIFTVTQENHDFELKYAKDHELDKSTKKLCFSIALEINSDKKLIDNEQNKIRLFCTFPLIGSENFRLPFLLNSPYFEILTERNGIVLDGNLYNSDNQLTNRGLNEIILKRSINLFKVILNWLINNEYSNFAIFANNIENSFVLTNQLNNEHLSISDIFRNILAESCIVKDSYSNKKRLNDVFLLNFVGVKNKKDFHNFASQFYTNIASFDDCILWKDLLWPKLNALTIEDFVEHISFIGQNKPFRYTDQILHRSNLLQNINSLTNDDFTFLNQFYSFLLREEPFDINNYSSKIWVYPIVLDSKAKFTLFSNLKSSKYLSEDLKKIMSLCETWGNKLIHYQIDSFSSIIQNATFEDAQKELNNFLSLNQNDIDLLLSLIKYIPKDNYNQIEIYKIAQKFLQNKIPSEIYVDNINESLWEKADEYLLQAIQNIISKFYNNEIDENKLDDYNAFYDLYQKNCRNSNFLVPNFNLVLKKREDLMSISNTIPQTVINSFVPFTSFDSYLHPSITSVKCNKVYNLDQFILDINELLNKNNDAICTVLNILPPSENQRLYDLQEKICNLAQFFLNMEIKYIKSNIVDELFWKKANESVIEQIKSLLKSNASIELLSNKLHKNKDQIFDHLNNYYSLIIQLGGANWKTDTLMPNYYGKFLPVKNLSILKDVSEDYLNFYNIIKNESDIRESFAHFNIHCDFLEIIDFPKFIDKICQNITDKQLISDNDIQQRIILLNPFSSLKKANNKLINKLYTVNIGNILNEINYPTENDKKRWVWELIQIVKDSLSNTKWNKIDIKFETKYMLNQCKKVIFSFNGPAFTEKLLFHLIFALNPYKNSFSYRKYGVGLNSTHALSKKIKITGNILQDKKVSGFSLVISREGKNDDELIKDFRKIQNSIQYLKEPVQNTTIIYEIKNKSFSDCVEKGLNNAENHFYQILINCPEIETISIITNKSNITYSIPNPEIQRFSNIKYNLYKIPMTMNGQNLNYIVVNDEQNKISVSVILNNNWEIVNNNENVKLFYTFPLVGSQLHKLPFYLNSPKFIPTLQCDGLVLRSKTESNEENKIIEINKSILMKSLPLFDKLINILINLNCQNIEEMTSSILITTNPYESFDLSWYNQFIITQMQEILLNNVKIKTFSNSIVNLKDAIFPSNEIKDEKLEKFISFVDQCLHNNIADKNNSINWRNKMNGKIKTISIQELIDAVKRNKDFLNDPSLKFYNDFLGFIWNHDKNLLYNNKIIPDMNNNFHNIPRENEDEDFRISKNVPDEIIELMEFISIPWKSTHMNTAIHSLRFMEDKKNDAQNIIIEKVKNDNNLCFDLMKYVLSNNDFRKDMFNIVVDLKKRNFDKYVEINDIDPSIWSFADSYVLNEIAKEISNYDQNKIQNQILYFKKFILVFMKYNINNPKIKNSTKIIPNAKYHLKSLDELYNKLDNCKNSFDIHHYLNNIFIENNLGIDFDDKIINPQIANEEIKSKKNETVNSFIFEINKIINKANINFFKMNFLNFA